jgi:hypothetical protein
MSNLNDSRGYQGNTNESKGVDVSKLIRENASDAHVLAALRSKYPNDVDLVNKLFSEYDDKMSRIRRKAQKFATLILTKYSHLGPKRILEKAKKYKKKYEFSDDEFNAFLNITLSDKSFSSANVQIPNTPLSRTLGHTIDLPVKMMVKSNELDVLQDILRIHQECSAVHAQVVIQALTYDSNEECKVYYTVDKKEMFDPKRDNMYSNVHPVVFALFAPKIKDLEDRMLLGSIAGIVAARYNGTQFKTQPDWLLYHDLIQDPNEIVCANNKDSPLIDLRNRVKVQCELWKCVRDLRMGKFYSPECTNFLVALKACKNNMYDSPDFSYIEDEGSVLRRLLSVFSYRPTIVAVRTLAAASPFSVAAPINTMSMTQVTTVPIINIRLPTQTAAADVPLATSLSSPDFYVENKVIVPKTKEVVYSRNVIFFYVNRRNFGLDHSKLVNHAMMPQFNVLPFSISGYESINASPISLDDIQVGSDKYTVKSVVCVESKTIKGVADHSGAIKDVNFITGCSAVVKCGNGNGVNSATAFTSSGTGAPATGTYAIINNNVVKYDPLYMDASTRMVQPLQSGVINDTKKTATVIIFVKG